jgi:hypothetical protein
MADLGERDVAGVLVRETEDVRGEHSELPDHLRGTRRRQQTDFPRENAGGQTHGEAVPIGAHVDDVLTGGQPCGQQRDIGKKLCSAKRRTRAVREYRISRRVRDQRESGQASSRPVGGDVLGQPPQ